jgi:hypothetical protein
MTTHKFTKIGIIDGEKLTSRVTARSAYLSRLGAKSVLGQLLFHGGKGSNATFSR